MKENSDDVSARLRHSLAGRGSAPQLGDHIVSGAATRNAPRLSRSPRRTLVFAGGITTSVAAIAVGALLIASPLQQPLFTAAGGAGGSAFGSSSDAETSETRIANWVTYEYQPGDNLSTDGGTGTVYQLKRTGSVEGRAAAVATAFGVAGTATKSQYFDPDYPTYVVGPEDGTAPSIAVTWTGTGNWWFNNPAAYPVVECAEAPAVEDLSEGEDVLIDPACGRPQTPAAENLAPSEAEARTIARSLFASTGLAVAESDIEVYADDWQTTATVRLVVDGITTALDWGVSWAPSGEISWAYGHSIEVVDRGSYGTISAYDAVARIADGRWFGAAGPDYQGGMSLFAAEGVLRGAETDESDAPAVDPPTDESTAEPLPDAEPSPETQPETEPTLEPLPLPVDPVDPGVPAEPEVVQVTVTSAEPTLLLLWDTNGDAWLVPGFAMAHPDGWWNTIVALVEGVIQLPEPVQIEPGVVEEQIAY